MKRCSYEFKSDTLHPSIKIGGCMSMGQCENECVPELVFCYEHASREAMAMVIDSCKKEISRLQKEISRLQKELRERDKNSSGQVLPRRRKT